jgi:hypothetical protein
MPILYLKNNATTAKSVRPTGYTFPAGLNALANTAIDYLVVAGGTGIVIISYASATALFTGGTVTTSGGNQIHTFTGDGSLVGLSGYSVN